ncbi:MAG TPA: hypothetical protein VFS60_06980 [Thermoanaerobaculia bacterium]|nr:hypothetical protein [Thermoanaerobaculia bacterium]
MRILQLLAAWSWLRWRALINALTGKRRSGGRKISAWLGLVLTIVLGLVGLGWAVGLSIGAWFAGRSIAAGDAGGPGMIGIRVGVGILSLLLAIFAVLSGGRSATHDWTRLLLLPIARRELHALELLAGLLDPWLLVMVPPLLVMAIALAPRGGTAAVVAAVGGALLFVVLGALATLLSLLVQLLLRDRRRAEVVVLVALLFTMTLGWAPGLFMRIERPDQRARREAAAPQQPSRPAQPSAPPQPSASPASPSADSALAEPRSRRHRHRDDRHSVMGGRWFQPLPSEVYARSLFLAAGGSPARAALPLATLAFEAVLFYSISALAWRRLVESPAVGSRRRRGLALPRLAAPSSPAGHPAVAVARAQVATTLRTVQGRVALVSPLLIAAATSLTHGFRAGGPFAAIAPLFGATAALALGPLSVMVYQNALLNQFGVDGAGFSLQVLSPLSERALVAGRALGGGALMLLALMPAMAVAALLHPGTPLLLWPATLLGGTAAYLLFAPAALWLSLLFPKAADLSKLGSKGKPHGAAALCGVLAVALALGLVQGLGAVGFLVGGAPGALLAETLLVAAAFVVAWPLLTLVAAALPARRDALLLALRAD